MISIDNLLTPMTTAEAKKSIYDVLVVLGVVTTNWKAGAVVRTIITAVAILVAALSRLVALIGRSGFLSTAQGDWHRLLAQEVYGVADRDATFASTTWFATNSGGGNYPLNPGDLILQNSVTKKQYYNTASVTIPPLTADVAVSIAAFEAGTESNAGAGAIDTLVTNLPGVSGLNSQAAVATDAMTDPERTALCLAKTVAVSPNGAREAYEYVALTALRADGSNVNVNRVTAVPDGTGLLNVYLASVGGSVPSGDVTVVDEAIQQNAAPLAVTVVVESATPKSVPVTYEVWIKQIGGIDEVSAKAAIEDALITFFASEPIGGHPVGVTRKLYKSAIVTSIGSAEVEDLKLPVFRAEVTVPAADVTLVKNEVPTLGTITAVVHLI